MRVVKGRCPNLLGLRGSLFSLFLIEEDELGHRGIPGICPPGFQRLQAELAGPTLFFSTSDLLCPRPMAHAVAE